MTNATLGRPAPRIHGWFQKLLDSGDLPIATPSAAAAGSYRSPLLRALLRGRAILAASLLLGVLLGYAAVSQEAGITRTVGSDTKASVVAAERIRTGLAQAHVALTASVAKREDEAGASAAVARQRTGEVMDALADAAKNITYGAEEQNPIDTVLRGLASYEADAGRARAGGPGGAAALLAADGRMQWTLLPAAAALDRVNAEHLDAAYRDRRGIVALAISALLALGVATLTLVALQLRIRRATRRQVSPWLAASTIVLCLGALASLTLGWQAFADMRLAKEDAFDSIGALWSARSVAADAEAAAEASLLPLDPAARGRIEDSYKARSLVVLGPAAPSGRRAGLLGDELANVTFKGEDEAARAAALAWTDFDAAEARVMVAARVSDANAVAMQTATRGSAEAAFRAFDAAMGKVIAINDGAFEAAIASARHEEGGAFLVLPVSALAALGLALFGLKRRIDEYRA